MNAKHPTTIGRLLLLATALSIASAFAGQETRYREREVLDPETGEWVAREAPEQTEPVDALDRARELLATDEPRAARDLLEDWLEENPDHERYFEGEFLLGEAWFLIGDYWKAVTRFQTVGENAAGPLFHRANERCVDVARAFLAGEKRILWKIFRLPAKDDGIEILDRVWEREPGSRLGELALKLKADHFYSEGDMDLAQDEYAHLVQQYPAGRYAQLAMLRSAEAAEAAFPGIRFDDRPLLEAAERYRQFQDAYPVYAEQENVAERLEGIRQTRADKDLAIARWYEKTGRGDAAKFYYQQVLNDWPDTLAATEARTSLRAMGVGEPGDDPADRPRPGEESQP